MIYRDGPVLQRCGHPYAARMVEPYVIVENGRAVSRLRSACWACKVQDEINAGTSPGTKREKH